MSKRDRSQVGVIEATYAPAQSETEWLRELAAAAAPVLDEGLGVIAYVYAGTGRVRCEAIESFGLRVPLDIFATSLEAMPADFVDRTWRVLGFGLCTETGPLLQLPKSQPMFDAGVRDVLNVNAYDASGVGVAFAVPLPAERARRPNEAEPWLRVASHLASALRLRRRGTIVPSPDAATAVLDTKGRLEHAANGKVADRMRDALRDGVVRMERARGPMRRSDPEGAVGLWRTLVEAELTLLDHFERGGKRYVIAVENPPTKPRGLSSLSRREQQVIALAAAGRSNKLIAYELGLAYSTVRVLLARAAQRLGVTSRREVVAIYEAHVRAERD